MRILIAFERNYRVYRDTIRIAIQHFRPSLEVEVVDLGSLEAEMSRLDPHLVISSRPNTVNPGGRVAWFTLSPLPDEPSEFCLNGRRSVCENPSLKDLLAVIDETKELLPTGRDLGGC
jgi:hypothetical protein